MPAKSFWRRLFSRQRLIAYSSLYLVALTVGWAVSLTDRLVMIPTTQPIRLNDVERVTIYVGTSYFDVSKSVDLWRRKRPADAPPAEAFALEFIGNGNRAEEVASLAFLDWGGHRVESYAMNYPGYGQSTGPARLKTSADAGLKAYDWLKSQSAGRPIFVVGTSLGTTVALHVAAERPDVAGVALTNPPPLRQLIRGRFGWWNLWLAATPISWGVPAELDSLANALRCHQPAMIITSGRDEVVPVEYQLKVIAAYAGPTRVLARFDAGHNDGVAEADRLWMSTQVDWLWSHAIAR